MANNKTKSTILLITYIICSFVPIYAQNQKVYSGISSDKNPMLRHHEAFFHAFMAFVKNTRVDMVENTIKGASTSNESGTQYSLTPDSCNLKIVSDIIKDSGEEIITISVDSGNSLRYITYGQSTKTDSEIVNTEFLEITYSDYKSSQAGYQYYKNSVILLDDSTEQKSDPKNTFKVSIVEERYVSE